MAILFVHGIAVRVERFNDLLKSVRDGVTQLSPGLDIYGCYWGDLASPEVFKGASVPGFLAGTRSPIDHITMDAADWIIDPLVQLTALRDDEEFTGGSGIYRMPPEVKDRNERLHQAVEPITNALYEAAPTFTGTGESVPQHTIRDLVRSVFTEAAHADRRLPVSDLCNPIEEALTAALWLEAAGNEGGFASSFNWTAARATVQAAVNEQLGGARGLGHVGQHSLSFAMRHGLRQLLMQTLAMGVGDVLVHAHHRQQILQRMHEAVGTIPADEPLTIVGHSLGGVIAFDYCRIASRSVARLVTVGSQVGLFAELGVFDCQTDERTGKLLPSIRAEQWLNLYDRDDVLSFLAAPVFVGAVDHEIDTGAPFPPAHSEYWHRLETYNHILRGAVI